MPIYEYRCENGHTFEVMQRMSDDPVAACQTCEARVQQVFHPIAVHFKGSGFYNTDYGTRKRSKELETSATGGADKTDAKSGDTKSGDAQKSDKAGTAAGGAVKRGDSQTAKPNGASTGGKTE